MKKMVLALATSSVLALANETTINETMSLMTQGVNQIQTGFVYSKKKDVVSGIKILQSANTIFTKVDVSTFIANNNKIQVTNNINRNLTANLKLLRKSVESDNYTDATKHYGEVMASCIACHRIVRGY